MENTGDQRMKFKARKLHKKMLIEVSNEYRTPFWNKVHKIVERIYEPNCTENEAREILIKVIGEVIMGIKENLCKPKDGHYTQEIFNDVDFIYAPGKFYSDPIYDIVELLDFEEDIENIEEKFRELLGFSTKLKEKKFNKLARKKLICLFRRFIEDPQNKDIINVAEKIHKSYLDSTKGSLDKVVEEAVHQVAFIFLGKMSINKAKEILKSLQEDN